MNFVDLFPQHHWWWLPVLTIRVRGRLWWMVGSRATCKVCCFFYVVGCLGEEEGVHWWLLSYQKPTPSTTADDDGKVLFCRKCELRELPRRKQHQTEDEQQQRPTNKSHNSRSPFKMFIHLGVDRMAARGVIVFPFRDIWVLRFFCIPLKRGREGGSEWII